MRRSIWRALVDRLSLAVVVVPVTILAMWGLFMAVLHLLSIDPEASLKGRADRVGALILVAACLMIGAVVGVATWLILYRAAFGYEQTSALIAEEIGDGRGGAAARRVLQHVFGDPR